MTKLMSLLLGLILIHWLKNSFIAAYWFSALCHYTKSVLFKDFHKQVVWKKINFHWDFCMEILHQLMQYILIRDGTGQRRANNNAAAFRRAKMYDCETLILLSALITLLIMADLQSRSY